MKIRQHVHRLRRYAQPALLLATILGSTGCVGSNSGSETPLIEENTTGLAAFDTCPQLLDYFKEEALFFLENAGEIEVSGGDFATGTDLSRDTGNAAAPENQGGGEPVQGDGNVAPAHSDTNIQERGVDEPDLVKTDGQLVYVAQGGRLLIHQADDLTEVSRVDLAGANNQIFLSGDHIIAIGRHSGELDAAFGEVVAEDAHRQDRTVIEVFDVRDPASPRQVRQTFVDGWLQTARLVDRTLRAVVFHQAGDALDDTLGSIRRNTPSVPSVSQPVDGGDSSAGSAGQAAVPDNAEVPDDDEDAEGEEDNRPDASSSESPLVVEGDEDNGHNAEHAAWLETVRMAIQATTLDDWLPKRYDAIGAEHTSGRVTSCGQFHRPGERSGLGVVAVVSINLDDLEEIQEDAAVVTGPGVAYMSEGSLYLTTANHGSMFRGRNGGEVDVAIVGGTTVEVSMNSDEEQEDTPASSSVPDAPAMGERQDPLEAEDIEATQIHRLDISAAAAQYIASGRVRGTPLNSFSLSEHAGHLRIATTEDRWRQDAERVNHVFVLETIDRGEDGELSVTGHIGDIAESERIYAARFMGEKGFLVTFRQVDPLFTLDLSDPSAPRIVGELKVPGFSTYLHPYSDDHLMGIGRSATEEGRITGMQLSLFDVSDFADPTLAHSLPLGQGHSEALYDHHAFNFWAPESLLMIPMISHDREGERSGIEFFRVDSMTGFEESGFVGHDDLVENKWSRVQRALVIGDNVISVGELGMKSNAIDTLDESARAVFPEPREHHQRHIDGLAEPPIRGDDAREPGEEEPAQDVPEDAPIPSDDG